MIFSASGDKKYIVFFTSLGDASVMTGDVVTLLGSGNENVVILSGSRENNVNLSSLGDTSVVTDEVVTLLGSEDDSVVILSGSGDDSVVICSGSGENNVNLSSLGDTSVVTDDVVILSGSGDDKGAIEARTWDLGLDARFKTLAYDILAQYNLQQSWVESFEFYQFFLVSRLSLTTVSGLLSSGLYIFLSLLLSY